MINIVRVVNFRGEVLEIDLRNPQLSGLAITRIDGIGGSTADISTTNLVGVDGAEFNSSRRQTRNITMSFRPVPVWRNGIISGSVEESRRLAYKFFPAKKSVRLEFITNFRSSYCTGYVESCESNIFDNPSTIDVSILCPDPNFYDLVGEVETVFSGTTSKFGFDIENSSQLYPVDDPSLVRAFSRFGHTDLVTGAISKFSRMNIPYEGEVDVGISIYLKALSNLIDGISFYNLTTYEEMDIDNAEIERITGSPLLENDIIEIHTSFNNKSVLLYRDAHYTNIINCINRDADWFQLSKGDNLLAYSATSGLDNLLVRVDHLVAYEGV